MSGAATRTQALPKISVPQAGRAMRGLGETLSTTSATGTATLSLRLPLAYERPGFPLALQLSYDSSGGNGPFRLGWQLSSAAITRKTDKSLPTYSDADIFMFRGGEEFVPRRLANGDLDTRDQGVFRVQRYPAHIEGTFSRVERWTHRNSSDAH